jgi:protein SCO1/2
MSAPDRAVGMSRRAFVAGAAAACAATPSAAHDELGPVTPRRLAPSLPLTLHDGRRSQLPALLQGRITALQLMFTGCSAICPVQGAVFAALQPLVIGPLPRAQLVSVSIDPLGDDARALAGWRDKFGADPAWLAAVPQSRHADVMPAFLGGRSTDGRSADRHTAATFLFDAEGRLAFRCAALASPRDIAGAMRELARVG